MADSTNARTLIRSTAVSGLVLTLSILLIAACTRRDTPLSPSPTGSSAHLDHAILTDPPGSHGTGADDDKGYIDGWFDGTEVSLFYTKTYFCAEPPTSAADGAGPNGCEIGANAEVPPRPGQIRKIYAIAPRFLLVPEDNPNLACPPGSKCLNHPLMIDASRVGGLPNGPGLPHSHILDERGGGWRQTVNIRVFSREAWNQIVTAKSLAKVRELQGDPAVGRPGVISADTPTNIFFFIASWR